MFGLVIELILLISLIFSSGMLVASLQATSRLNKQLEAGNRVPAKKRRFHVKVENGMKCLPVLPPERVKKNAVAQYLYSRVDLGEERTSCTTVGVSSSKHGWNELEVAVIRSDDSDYDKKLAEAIAAAEERAHTLEAYVPE